MKRILASLLMALFLLASGCDTTGEPVAYERVCDLGNDKKSIETEGFLDDAGGVFCSNTSGRMECGLKLKQSLKDEKGFTADVAIGSGANTMDELSSGYKPTDIAIRNNDGNVIDLGEKVKVTGTLSAYEDTTSPGKTGCFIKVYKIEQK